VQRANKVFDNLTVEIRKRQSGSERLAGGPF
jgi:hypothetical protein